MKRYKQTILSNFFVTADDLHNHHLVEANLDIESRDDRTLCTDVLHRGGRYQVLTNELLPTLCSICTAILIRRINNMPQENTLLNAKFSKVEPHSSVTQQLPLNLPCVKIKENSFINTFEQFELIWWGLANSVLSSYKRYTDRLPFCAAYIQPLASTVSRQVFEARWVSVASKVADWKAMAVIIFSFRSTQLSGQKCCPWRDNWITFSLGKRLFFRLKRSIYTQGISCCT